MSDFFDDKAFLRGLNLADKKVRAAAVKGLGKAAISLLDDAVNEAPTVPLDEGTLRGSGSAIVQGKLVKTSESEGEGGTPALTAGNPEGGDVIEAVVGFNTPYAAHLHEHPEYTFGETRTERGLAPARGTGGKYLERPLVENEKDYVGIVAKTIRGALK